MNFFEIISTAINTIKENKLRTILTMFGIIIGVGAVIMILSIGNGFKDNIKKDLDKLELDKFTIISRRNKHNNIYPINMEDIELIKTYKNLEVISPSYDISTEEDINTLNNELVHASLNGITEEYYKLKSTEYLLYGKYISSSDVKNKYYVAVIGNKSAKKIFGYENVVGKKIKINTGKDKKVFTIIGVVSRYENKGRNNFQSYFLDSFLGNIFVPITCVQEMENKNNVTSVDIKVTDKNKISDIARDIVNLLKIKNKEAVYETFILEDFISDINKVINIFSLFLSFVASISLLVGGIGVMNIMLVSVTERTKEIGIRKSLGATNLNIKIQFLIEAIVISIIGGLMGIFVGYMGSILASNIINKFMLLEIVPFINLFNVLIVTLISLSIGVIFGVYPAGKAAKLDPVESLMFE